MEEPQALEVVDRLKLLEEIKQLNRPHGVSWRDQMAVLDQVEETILAMPYYIYKPEKEGE